MRRVIYIVALFYGVITYGQHSRMLQAADFKNQTLDEQWIYVKYKEGRTPTRYQSSVRLADSENSSRLSGILKIKVPPGKDAISYCNELRRSTPDLVYADPIVKYVPLSTPSDALIDNQYYLGIIRAYDAWDITTGDDDITIAIIDSGIDLDHEDIATNLWINTDDPIDGVDNDSNGFIDDLYGYDFADLDTDPSIQNGNHGMIVAGIAGATTNNDKGIAGVGYNTKVAALKGFKSSNGQSGGLYDAIIYAAENGFDVANLSWGRMGVPLQSEQDIINYAVLDHDMVLVAAAGNEGGKTTEQNKWYPASYENVLSVGASDAGDNKSSGSTFNHLVDLVAPGVSMYSTVNNNGYSNGGPGTSFASPQVAATAALVKDQYPELTAIQIMERVRVTADDIYDVGSNSTYDGKLGKGRLNALRAVSESNVKSLRAESPSLTSRFGDQVFFGDTVMVRATLTNHLSAINSPLITISSPNDDFTISTGSFQPGFMSSQDTQDISFDVILDENIAPETDIEIRLDYSASGYADFQFLEVTTSPDYADFGNSNLTLTISGDGNLGFDDYNPFEGSGLMYQLDTLITYAGLLVATGTSQVSDNIVSDYSNNLRDQDFAVQEYYRIYHHPGADHFGYSEFEDFNRDLFIEQSNITWENENFLIIRYRLVNNSPSPITNISIGTFADWDLEDETTNYAEYDLAGNYIFARNSTSDLFAGIQVLGGDSFEYSALDMGAFNGNSQDIDNLFSDADKYEFLVNQSILTAGGTGSGNDVATLNGVTINQIDAYSEEFVNVIYAVSDSKVSLENEFSTAINQLDQFLLNPRVLETFSVCAGSSLSIDPSDGDTYEFYEDPLAQDLISTGSSFDPGTITKDTLFYARNVDNNYPSDIFEIRVKLFNEIADFELSTDTLYLDDPTTNVVQFTDMSLDAISWNWDFDQGTTSTLQHPSLSLTSTGTYSITLQVENALGCIDSITKDLVVANRPSSPTFSDITICPGENVTLTEPTAEKVRVYIFENSLSPVLSGSSVLLEAVSQDTVVYVSGIYGSLESDKVPVSINVLEVHGTIMHRPDTTTENHQIIFSADGIDEDATVNWTVDGSSAGSETEIAVPAVAGTIEVTLEITSSDDCTRTLNKEILVSTSPFAAHPDLISCNGQEVDIRPSNGNYFGFYEDDDLTILIKKGSHLTTNQHNQVYVVNLDDGLPGMPIEVNIAEELLAAQIIHTITPIGEQHQVDLSVESDNELSDYKWYINGTLSETSSTPTFFFNNQLFEIVLETTSTLGCSDSDTLIVDFTPPLALEDSKKFSVYPNPTDGMVKIQAEGEVVELTLFSLDGQVVANKKDPEDTIDLEQVSEGLYIIRAQIGNAIYEQYVLIR